MCDKIDKILKKRYVFKYFKNIGIMAIRILRTFDTIASNYHLSF